MDNYQHDVFISYRREEAWTQWTRDHFKRLLKTYLQQELGVPPDIFVDERIQVSADWVDGLGEHLATSKVLLAIFSADYFGSDWCLHELDLMLGRSKAASRDGRHVHLIVPVVVHDGELIPKEVKRIQPADMAKYRIAYINEASPDYHDFSKAMKLLAPQVADVIRTAPAFNEAWIEHHRTRFNRVFDALEQQQHEKLENFAAQRPNAPASPPRLIF